MRSTSMIQASSSRSKMIRISPTRSLKPRRPLSAFTSRSRPSGILRRLVQLAANPSGRQRRHLAQGFDGLSLERQLVHCALRATTNIAIHFYSIKLIALLHFASWSEEIPQQACMHLRRRRPSRIRLDGASNGRSRMREKRLRDVKYIILIKMVEFH